MSEVIQTFEGWYVLHDFRSIDWPAWKAAPEAERQAAIDEFNHISQTWQEKEDQKEGSTGIFSILGHKADLALMHLRPSLEELQDLEIAFNKTRLSEFTIPSYSYLSVVELSTYTASSDVDPDTNPYIQGRLKPILPKTNHICFYPMNKRREGDDNWYTLPMDDRRAMMKSHGMIGRKYAGQVTQIISGSVGLDDWEWGVTLFADDPVTYKKLIYEMRFDEASARFADFGSFYVGNRLSDHQITNLLDI